MPMLHRIVLANPPAEHDFLSDRTRGKPRPTDPNLEPYWHGLSAYATEAQARKKARRVPMLGTAIAVLDLPDDDPSIRFERSLKSSGHYTVWGDPSVLLSRVQSVVPVEPGAE